MLDFGASEADFVAQVLLGRAQGPVAVLALACGHGYPGILGSGVTGMLPGVKLVFKWQAKPVADDVKAVPEVVAADHFGSGDPVLSNEVIVFGVKVQLPFF